MPTPPIVWGTEGRHAWTPDGAEEAAVTLNYRSADDGTPAEPRVWIKTIPGLRSAADATDNADVAVGAEGEFARASNRRGKTIVYEGFLEAKLLADFREWESVLLEAFNDLTPGRMTITPHPLYDDTEGIFRYFDARPQGVEIGEPNEARGILRGTFLLALRNHSGLLYDENDTPFR